MSSHFKKIKGHYTSLYKRSLHFSFKGSCLASDGMASNGLASEGLANDVLTKGRVTDRRVRVWRMMY